MYYTTNDTIIQYTCNGVIQWISSSYQFNRGVRRVSAENRLHDNYYVIINNNVMIINTMSTATISQMNYKYYNNIILLNCRGYYYYWRLAYTCINNNLIKVL